MFGSATQKSWSGLEFDANTIEQVIAKKHEKENSSGHDIENNPKFLDVWIKGLNCVDGLTKEAIFIDH